MAAGTPSHYTPLDVKIITVQRDETGVKVLVNADGIFFEGNGRTFELAFAKARVKMRETFTGWNA